MIPSSLHQQILLFKTEQNLCSVGTSCSRLLAGAKRNVNYPQNENLKAAKIEKLVFFTGFEQPAKVVLDALRVFANFLLSRRFE